MVDYARLVVSVDSRQVRNADRDMVSMSRSAEGLTGGLSRMIAPLVSVATAMAALNKAVIVQRQFDVLNAGLMTATGSSERAAEAFQALQDFAAKTPYSLDQAVEGFTKLVNIGLTPSEEALMSYGNTASAMGKDLSQMIEAVADAATGEFERLKEFGIRAKVEGDQVSLTFQGTTTTVRNSTAEIEKYLTSLGQNQFAGAMAQRMETLDGAISNLGDTWDQTFRLINEAGAGELMEDAVRGAIGALEELNASLASGQLEGYLDAVVGKFDGFGRDVDSTFDILTRIIESDTGRWDALLQNNIDTMIATFRDFPENVRAFIQIMTVEVLAGFDKVTAYTRAFNDSINAIFSGDTWEGVGARLEQELSVIDSTREGSLTGIMAERDAALASFDSQIEAADELRKTYDELREARAGQGGDRLAQFGKSGSEGGDSGSAAEAKKLADAYTSLVRGLERQKALYGQTGEAARINYELTKGSLKGVVGQQADYLIGLARELDAKRDLSEQEQLRIDILRESGQLRAANDAQFQLEYAEKIAEYERQGNVEALQRLETLRRIREIQMNADQAPGTVEGVTQAPRSSGLDAVVGGAGSELIRLQQEAVALEEWRSMELEKQRAFLEAKAINEQQYAERVANIYQQSADGVANIQGAQTLAVMSLAQGLTSDLMSLMQQAGQENTALYKAMFLAQKSIAIGQAIISTELAAVAAMAPPPFGLGPVAGLPYSQMIRTLGYASVGIIGAQTAMGLSGMAHDGIDSVPKEGTWLLDKGERVVDRRTNADLKDYLAGKGGGSAPQITINAPVTVEGQAGLSEAEARQQGQITANAIDAVFVSRIEKESRPGGLLWNLYGGGR